MTPNNSRLNIMSAPASMSYAAQKLNQLQADLVTTARTLAVDEVSAAIAHQLNEPLTALLLYLSEIKANAGHFADTETDRTSLQQMAENALRETERACEIMARADPTNAIQIDAAAAFVRDREGIDGWPRRFDHNGSHTSPGSRRHRLTPRERDVLTLITSGVSNKEGGRRLGISTRTFELHRAHVMEKHGAKNAADLVRIVLSENR